MEDTLTGKNVLLTGGTNGIGFVAARELARMDAQVVIVGRNEEKSIHTAKLIFDQTGRSIETILADLSTLVGIRHTALTFKETHQDLHILINNAGGMFIKRRMTPDGFEYTFALNHINFFLLTSLLLDTMKASAPSRIINTSSNAHEWGQIEFDNLQGEKRYRGLKAYGQTKLANLLFTYELARRLEGTNVTVNAVHPGFVATGFARNNGPIYNIGTWIAGKLFGRKPERGAETTIYLASSPKVEGISGKYFMNCQEIESAPQSYDRAVGKKLWQVTEALINKAS